MIPSTSAGPSRRAARGSLASRAITPIVVQAYIPLHEGRQRRQTHRLLCLSMPRASASVTKNNRHYISNNISLVHRHLRLKLSHYSRYLPQIRGRGVLHLVVYLQLCHQPVTAPSAPRIPLDRRKYQRRWVWLCSRIERDTCLRWKEVADRSDV